MRSTTLGAGRDDRAPNDADERAARRAALDALQAGYRKAHERHLAAAEVYERLGHRIGNFRGLSFVIALGGFGAALAGQGPIATLVGAIGALAFFFLVAKHDRVLSAEQQAERRSFVSERAERRVSGTWRSLPDDGTDLGVRGHAYADDLDLFGPGSLYQRISVAHTRYGRARLAEFLAEPAGPDEARLRQAAAAELATELELRQSFEAEAMALAERGTKSERQSGGPDPARLIAWAEKGQEIPGGALTTLLAFSLPVATVTGIVLHTIEHTGPLAWVVPLVLSLALLSFTRSATSEAFGAASTTQGAFLRYGELLLLLERYQPESTWLKERLSVLGGGRASRAMRSFSRRVAWFDLRHNGMLYPFVNAILLWDVHCTRALLAWRRSLSGELPSWFRVLGEFEAVSSLAALHHDEPGSTFPTLDADRLEAECLGHPLVPANTRVENDVAPFGPGEALLVTGSNMSGKSTFLRTLGLGIVLAYAGGPVTARRASFPRCRLGTSIRISDSLARGVSHFYAEVEKLAAVVTATAGEVTVFFLLDEVLHGTNSRERQIGARWVLAELLSRGAFGVITTHDMELCRLEEPLMNRVRQHHFSEQVEGDAGSGGGTMTFDYQLRSGPVTSGNALRLMRHVGLSVPLE